MMVDDEHDVVLGNAPQSIPQPATFKLPFTTITGPTIRLANFEPMIVNKSEQSKIQKDTYVSRKPKMVKKYEIEGMRRSVEAVLVVHLHSHPHVLLLQNSNKFYQLPGGSLHPGEDEIEGLLRKLDNKICPILPDSVHNEAKLEVSDLLTVLWRPNFEAPQYPYIPAHVTKPKECRRIYIIPVPENCTFHVAPNCDLVAVPLCGMHGNAHSFGSVISSLPSLMARINFICM
eukprot:TRINITY_DN10174_c0_g1_i1.p1 TRINITY_DN10174_c0_g1~~TRINITY_DN10174_c0_g1_i1.p1  ORF type:complete len:231 (+),score=37.96 TRINITY_DN10174_c0_g1_i1:156-848(+)